jgi:hypothetical protein
MIAQGNYKYAVVVVEYFTKWIEIFQAKHNMPFWSVQRDNSRQRQAIWSPHIQGFLLSDGGRSSFRISISPLVQQSSGKSECIDIHNHKEDIREIQAKAHRSWGSSVAAKPAHGSLRKIGT